MQKRQVVAQRLGKGLVRADNHVFRLRNGNGPADVAAQVHHHRLVHGVDEQKRLAAHQLLDGGVGLFFGFDLRRLDQPVGYGLQRLPPAQILLCMHQGTQHAVRHPLPGGHTLHKIQRAAAPQRRKGAGDDIVVPVQIQAFRQHVLVAPEAVKKS